MKLSRAFLLSLVPVVAFQAAASADPILLGSRTRGASGGTAPEKDLRVQIVLAFPSDVPFVGPRLGEGIFWKDGDTGTIDFDSRNEDDFTDFTALLTNGVDDELAIFVLTRLKRGIGNGWPESVWFDGSPDLVGNQIDFIRLIVHNLEIVPYTDPFDPNPQDGIMWDLDWTYEFWGHPVPEPSTVALFGLAGAIVFGTRRRSRR